MNNSSAVATFAALHQGRTLIMLGGKSGVTSRPEQTGCEILPCRAACQCWNPCV